ncbi:MAG: Type restriction-modification system, specificity subunit [Acidobacteriaceae bacterium]|nr:Type restriction-modification system, specificity subunit [Acidobacteriaceae bacterium]
MIATVDEACDMVTDGTHFTPKNVGNGVPFLTVKDVTDSKLDFVNCSFITHEDYRAAKAGNSAPQEGDVLFSKDGTVGKVHVVMTDEPFAVLSSLAILRPKRNRVDSKYLGHVLRSPMALEDAIKRKTGSAIRRIVLSDLKRVQIPLPSLAEQRLIAEVLDRAEALRAKRRAALTQLDTLTQSIFLDLFGDPATNPKRWPVVPLQEVVKRGTVVTYGIVQAGEEYTGGVPYIRTGDIADGEILQLGLRHTNPAIAAKFLRSRVESGEIVMSIRATVGTTALVPPELDGANLTQGTARIAPGESVERTYLLYYLRSSAVQHWISLQIKGATFREITLTRLRELPIRVPPLSAQRGFASKIAAVENLKRLQRDSFSRLNKLFNALQSGAFRGDVFGAGLGFQAVATAWTRGTE